VISFQSKKKNSVGFALLFLAFTSEAWSFRDPTSAVYCPQQTVPLVSASLGASEPGATWEHRDAQAVLGLLQGAMSQNQRLKGAPAVALSANHLQKTVQGSSQEKKKRASTDSLVSERSDQLMKLFDAARKDGVCPIQKGGLPPSKGPASPPKNVAGVCVDCKDSGPTSEVSSVLKLMGQLPFLDECADSERQFFKAIPSPQILDVKSPAQFLSIVQEQFPEPHSKEGRATANLETHYSPFLAIPETSRSSVGDVLLVQGAAREGGKCVVKWVSPGVQTCPRGASEAKPKVGFLTCIERDGISEFSSDINVLGYQIHQVVHL
jgi:hypothetical protein